LGEQQGEQKYEERAAPPYQAPHVRVSHRLSVRDLPPELRDAAMARTRVEEAPDSADAL
jgi:hypothetical protein